MKDTTHVAVGVIGQTGSVPAVEPGVPPDGTGAITPEHIPTATANNGPAGEVTSPRESQPSTIGSNEEPATFNLRPAADPVCATATPEQSEPSDHQLSTLNPQPVFPRSPGETPRAFNAFITFFDLGHSRSLQGVSDTLGEKLDTIKKWSSRFRWADRIHSFNTGLLQQHADAQAAAHAEWEKRTARYREREWVTAEKLLQAVDCFLSDFSDHHVDKMTIAQVSRAFQIVSNITRSNLSNGRDSGEPALAPIQIELTAALKTAYSSQQMPNEPRPLSAPGEASVRNESFSRQGEGARNPQQP